jgi:hypothetical protein
LLTRKPSKRARRVAIVTRAYVLEAGRKKREHELFRDPFILHFGFGDAKTNTTL